jgi:hypothetical protein
MYNNVFCFISVFSWLEVYFLEPLQMEGLEEIWYGSRLVYRKHATQFHKLSPEACFTYATEPRQLHTDDQPLVAL